MANLTGKLERGVLLNVGPSRDCDVRFDDGREIRAVLAVHTLQKKHGCLFGSLVGWTVDVEVSANELPPRVVSLRSLLRRIDGC